MFSKNLNTQEKIAILKILFQNILRVLSVRGNACQVQFQECSRAADVSGLQTDTACSVHANYNDSRIKYDEITSNPKYIISFSTKSAVKTIIGSCVYNVVVAVN